MDGLSTAAIVAIAVVALAATLGASEVLVRGVGRLAHNLSLIGGLVGLLVALGADSPEISSAVAALANGSPVTGAGIVLGSNVFNVAVLLGVGTLAAGPVSIHRAAVLLDAGVAIAVTLVLGATMIGAVPLAVMWVVLFIVFTPYVAYLGMRPAAMNSLPLPAIVRAFLVRASSEADVEGDEIELALEEYGRAGLPRRSWRPVLQLFPALLVIVLGSTLVVQTALTLGARFRVPDVLIGVIVLAAATSLPNVYAATRLAMAGHGAALVSATFNSNTLNVIAGIAIPAIFVPSLPASIPRADVVWLLGVSVLSLVQLARGLRRRGAVLLLAVYVAFVGYTVVTG